MIRQPSLADRLLLSTAYWSTLALGITSFFLALFLLLLVSGNGSWQIQFLQPLIVACVPWMYLDVLARAYWKTHPQRARGWLMVVAAAGALTLVLVTRSVVAVDHDPEIFLVPIAVGVLSFAAVCRIIGRTRGPSDHTTSAIG